jgi:hypothetical protein
MTFALPMNEASRRWIDKSVINPGKQTTDALTYIALKPTDGVFRGSEVLATATTPKQIADKIQRISNEYDKIVEKPYQYVEKTANDVSKWMVKNPVLVGAIAKIVVAAVCSWAFGAYGPVIAKAIIYKATTPPDPIPSVPGAITGTDLGLGSVGPELSEVLRQYCVQQGYPMMLIPVEGTAGIWVPALPESIVSGTVAALDWTSEAVRQGYISKGEAIQILALLGETIDNAVQIGMTDAQMIEVDQMIMDQIQAYQTGVTPGRITQNGINPLFLLAGAGVLAYIALSD